MEREPTVSILHSAADREIPASGEKESGGIREKLSVGGVKESCCALPSQLQKCQTFPKLHSTIY